MPARNGAAHVVTTTCAYKDKVYRTHLLRRSYREDGKVKNQTLGNLSSSYFEGSTADSKTFMRQKPRRRFQAGCLIR